MPGLNATFAEPLATSGTPADAITAVPVTTSRARIAAIIAADGSTDAARVIFAQGENDLHPMASLTKIMTAMVLLDGQPDNNEIFTCLSCDAATGSGANLAEGDAIGLQDTVLNMMLPSSNVTANMVARIYGGKLLAAEGQRDFTPARAVSRWVAQMNDKARTLEMYSARFSTPSGLGSNTATALDMLKMIAAATRYPLIMQSWGKQASDIRIAGSAPRVVRIINTHDLLFTDPAIIGGKTGTLTPVFNLFCLAQLPDGQRVAVIALSAATRQDRATDCAAMLAAIKARYPAQS